MEIQEIRWRYHKHSFLLPFPKVTPKRYRSANYIMEKTNLTEFMLSEQSLSLNKTISYKYKSGILLSYELELFVITLSY